MVIFWMILQKYTRLIPDPRIRVCLLLEESEVSYVHGLLRMPSVFILTASLVGSCDDDDFCSLCIPPFRDTCLQVRKRRIRVRNLFCIEFSHLFLLSLFFLLESQLRQKTHGGAVTVLGYHDVWWFVLFHIFYLVHFAKSFLFYKFRVRLL